MERVSKRIGLLHLAPKVGQLQKNRSVIEVGTRLAASYGADWVLSGELVVPGYRFEQLIGTSWITTEPDGWLARYALLAKELGVAVFVNHPEKDGSSYFNTLFAIDATGTVRGRHRKICVTPVAEDWSTPGTDASPVTIDGVSVGMLICADASRPGIAMRLRELGAQVILSSAAWHPGEWGPAGEWEARSDEAQLPIIVCNRTGDDVGASFVDAPSVLVVGGRRIEEMTSKDPTLFMVELTLSPTETSLALVDQRPL